MLRGAPWRVAASAGGVPRSSAAFTSASYESSNRTASTCERMAATVMGRSPAWPGASMAAPRSISSCSVAWSPSHAATCSGESPSRLAALMQAPASSSTATVALTPEPAARCRAVSAPDPVLASTATPLASSRRTSATCPIAAAACSGDRSRSHARCKNLETAWWYAEPLAPPDGGVGARRWTRKLLRRRVRAHPWQWPSLIPRPRRS